MDRRALAVAVLLAAACGEDVPLDVAHPLDDELRLNHLQAKGTHNSYHVETTTSVPDWNYTHAPLAVQLADQGVRKLELDVWWDHFGQGYRVYHAPLADEGSTCDLLVECLAEIDGWSRSNPGHHTIFVQLEPKDQPTGDEADTLLAALEAELRAVFPPSRLVTPELVRGGAPTLAAAIAGRGWPTLGEGRGRILFFLDCDRELCVRYAGDDGRLAFAASRPEDPFAAVMLINDPVGRADELRAAVEAGFLVRTMTDGVPVALEDDRSRLEAALANGAHLLSTDVPAPRDDTPYWVEIPGGTPTRCNPVVAPEGCFAEAIEDPALLRGR